MGHDLSLVAPHRRGEVLRRIDVLERFVAAPGRRAAEAAAAELGLGPTQLYRLAKVWKTSRSPELLAGSTRPRERRSLASADQLSIVELTSAAMPEANVTAVAVAAIAAGAVASVAMPGVNAVRKVVEMARVGRVSPASGAAGADIVVTSCAIDLPVAGPGGGEPTMPICTLAILTKAPVAVAGVSVGTAAPATTAAAAALLDALRAGGRTDDAVAGGTVAIEYLDDADVPRLLRALADAGLELRLLPRPLRSTTHDAVALLGRKLAGFRLMPGLTSRPAAFRRPSPVAGGIALEVAAAEDLLRSRLVDQKRTSAFDHLPEDVRFWLARSLAKIV